MDLSLLKKFFQAGGQVQGQLRKHWSNFQQDSSFTIYKSIALKSQPQINAQMLREFIVSFNWEVSFITCNEVNSKAEFEIKTLVPDMSSDKVLDFGIQLLLKHWGKDGVMNFQMFCKLIKGGEDNPEFGQKQLAFTSKKNLFELLIGQINGLIRIEAFKKAVFHQYRNKTDLFQMLTPNNTFDQEQLNMLFLSLSERKSKEQIVEMSNRAKLPWNFNQFLETFKSAANKNNQKQYKVHYSSKRNKGENTPNDKAYTTPRKSKAIYGHSSTKVTKGEVLQDLIQSSKEVSQFSFNNEGRGKIDTYVDILGDILQLQEEFIKESATLIKREDFDLELAYEHHGKKFQYILNQRYGVCNFSAFVRFIVPRDFDHRYLSFIRYQANNTLSSTTEQMLQDLLISHQKKEKKIKELWNECDLELLQRAFCQPSQKNMKTEKLRQYFTKRQTTILADRLDPCKKGFIQISDLR